MKTADKSLGGSWFVVRGSLRHGRMIRPTAGDRQRTTNNEQPTCSAFTLVELLVVVAIIGLVMTISIPSIYRKLHPDSINKAVEDVMDACRYARGRAILEGAVTELVFRPADRTIEVVPTGMTGHESSEGRTETFASSEGGDALRLGDQPHRSGGGGSIFSTKLSDRIIIEGLGINGLDYTEDDVSRIRFFPNGTSEEMSLVLLSDRNERRNITLEVVTALPNVEIDPYKFKHR